MKKFNAEEALNGAPVKLKNGLKAYIEKYHAGNVFVYSGYVAGKTGEVRSWNGRGKEYFNFESPYDIVAMWGDEEQESETKLKPEGNIFEKSLKDKLPLRYTILEDNVNDFYCIAKTSDGDYILERKDTCAVYVTKLSLFVQSLEWYIVVPKLPKAFKPNEGEEFWFIHTMKNKTVSNANYCDNDVYYNGLANAGLAFRTKEEATQALHFLRSNIEDNNGEEQK